MRTTLDLSDAAYHVAKAVAQEKKISLGKAVSQLILGDPSTKSPAIIIPDDPTALPIVRFGRMITEEDVKSLEDEW